MIKIRLDLLLVKRNLVSSREKAQRLIMSGNVTVNDHSVTKPGHQYSENCNIKIKKTDLYVSRGGYKIAEAYRKFNLKIQDNICLDIGSSTGGFTDFLLQHKAKKVYAVDCGTNQIHWKLRNDDRVIVMENTNARYLSKNDINENIDLSTIDVSFISLKKILPTVVKFLNDKGQIIALIKPQFEAGREHIQKGGVIIDKKIHNLVIEDIKIFATDELQLKYIGICQSPIKGPAGNIEFLSFWEK